MQYANVTKGVFLARLNRFAARVSVGGSEETVHVKNTGRCRELFLPCHVEPDSLTVCDAIFQT